MNQWAVFCLLLKLLFELCTGTHVQVVPGSTLELPCFQYPTSFSGLPITWTFNGNDIISQVSVKTNATHLSISPVSSAAEGKYACSVMDTVNNVEMTRTYHVTIKALISYVLVVKEDAYFALLPCNFLAEYDVEAHAQWFKEMDNGKRTMLIPSDGTFGNDKAELPNSSDHDQTMKLWDVKMEDDGLYHCESPDGTRLSTVRLIVKRAPTPPPHSCQGFTGPWETCEVDLSHSSELVLRESLTEFSWKLYSIFRQSNPHSNLLYSPISINTALSHLLLGARDTTRAAIERALSLPHDFHCVHSAMKRLRENLSASLQMASQIYYNTGKNFNESFVKQSVEFYDSEPVRLKNSSEENTHMINSWVANKTKNKITQLVKSVSDFTQLMLLNAVSFSGMWTVKFDEKPKKAHFTKLNGDMIRVPVLHNEKFQGSMIYFSELKAQVMKFGLTGNSSLYILLPQSYQPSDLLQVELRLTDAAVHQMIDEVNKAVVQRIEVTLPQIKLNVEPDMNVLMKKLGLSTLYEDANLCGMYADDPLLLDEAKHKAYLELTEKGVEAGAVTALGYSRSFLSFSALRPFILLLWSDHAEVPLYIGRVTEP